MESEIINGIEANAAILSVGGDKAFHDFLSRLFMDELIDVICADSIESANAVLLTTGVGAIILDFHIGEERGLDFIIDLKRSEKTARIPVIAFTATLLRVNLYIKAVLLGAYHCFSKSVSSDEIVKAVKLAIADRM